MCVVGLVFYEYEFDVVAVFMFCLLCVFVFSVFMFACILSLSIRSPVLVDLRCSVGACVACSCVGLSF